MAKIKGITVKHTLFIFSILLCTLGTSFITHADSIRLPDGTSCTFDTYNSPWELSVSTAARDNDTDYEKFSDPVLRPKSNVDRDDFEVRGQIKYKFGGPERLQCGRLFELQLRIKEAELKKLEMQMAKLEKAQDIDWDEEPEEKFSN